MCMVHARYWSIGAWILPPAHLSSFLGRIKLLALNPIVGGNQALGRWWNEAQLLFHVSAAVSKAFTKQISVISAVFLMGILRQRGAVVEREQLI